MKSLKKMKLINWHYFWNQTIEFQPLVFLTGLNGSGKSTLAKIIITIIVMIKLIIDIPFSFSILLNL